MGNSSINSLCSQLHNNLPPNTNKILVGYSGGLDSTVLLHALKHMCTTRATSYMLQALHIHHGLSPHADQWAQHCQTMGEQWGIPVRVEYAQIQPKKGESIEAVARTARYAIYRQHMCPHSVLLLGHHADDQAETVLLQLLRGAGPRGLSAMSAIMPFAEGHLMRPLLTLTRQQLVDYAQSEQLKWIEDESNQSVDYDRNYLRHQVMPLLRERWPGMANCLLRSAHHCAESETLNQVLALQDWEHIGQHPAGSLSVAGLMQLSLPRQANLLRYWLTQRGLPLPATVRLQEVMHLVLHARQDASPKVCWPGVEIRRYRDKLYAMPPLLPYDPTWCAQWLVREADFILPFNLGTLKAVDFMHKYPTRALTLRFRYQGEVVRLPGRTLHHTLKHVFQTLGIPPWLRARVPLLFCDDILVAIVSEANTILTEKNI